MVHSSLKVSHCENDSAVQSTASASLLHSLNPAAVHQPPLESSTPCSAYFRGSALQIIAYRSGHQLFIL